MCREFSSIKNATRSLSPRIVQAQEAAHHVPTEDCCVLWLGNQSFFDGLNRACGIGCANSYERCRDTPRSFENPHKLQHRANHGPHLSFWFGLYGRELGVALVPRQFKHLEHVLLGTSARRMWDKNDFLIALQRHEEATPSLALEAFSSHTVHSCFRPPILA
jgi:hypothetical protein